MPAERGNAPAHAATATTTAEPADAAPPSTWWPILRRLLAVAFVLGIGVLIVVYARDIDWRAVGDALRAYRWPVLFGAGLLAALSHTLYSSYDLIGRHLTQHGLARRTTMAVAFVSYVFNLNFGSLVGGVAMRFRLYVRLGLKPGVVTHVLAVSVLTNWLGYAALAGAWLIWLPLPVPSEWRLHGGALRALGALLLGGALFYVLACAKAKRRRWIWRGRHIVLPSGRLALLQLTLSSCNWMVMAGTIFVLLGARVDYGAVLGALLLAAVAGVISHVPAGLGVLEAVFLALLSQRAAPAELLASLLAYRGLYYLAPLAVALPTYFLVGRRRVQNSTQNTPITNSTTSTSTSNPKPPEGP